MGPFQDRRGAHSRDLAQRDELAAKLDDCVLLGDGLSPILTPLADYVRSQRADGGGGVVLGEQRHVVYSVERGDDLGALAFRSDRSPGPLELADAAVAIDAHHEYVANARTAEGKTMKIDVQRFGSAPKDGHSLYISMHGGGATPPSVRARREITQARKHFAGQCVPRGLKDRG